MDHTVTINNEALPYERQLDTVSFRVFDCVPTEIDYGKHFSLLHHPKTNEIVGFQLNRVRSLCESTRLSMNRTHDLRTLMLMSLTRSVVEDGLEKASHRKALDAALSLIGSQSFLVDVSCQE